MKYLFVLSGLGHGGGRSSFIALYNRLKNNRDLQIKVFALSHNDAVDFPLKDILLPKSSLLEAYYGDFRYATGCIKLFSLIIKPLKHLALKIGWNLERFISLIEVAKLEHRYSFDGVVSFIEGGATVFTSYFKTNNKIAWVHCDYKFTYSKFAQTRLPIYDKYRSIVCVSKYTAKTFVELFPSLSGKVVSIYNFLDGDRIIRLSQEPIDDGRFMKNDNGLTIISVGRIVDVKRFSVIPEIVRQLLDRKCNVRWYILGPGISDEAKMLEQNIKKFNVLESVICLGKKTNPYPYFLKSDILVSLSISEACPMVFCEAKILHLPIVTTNFGSAAEFIDSGRTGLVCPIEKIADNLIELYSNKRLYETFRSVQFNYDTANNVVLRQLTELLLYNS